MLTTILGLLILSAAPACPCQGCERNDAQSSTPTVAMVRQQSENFSIWSYDTRWPATKVGMLAEDQRHHLYWHWQENREPGSWTPTCILVVHNSRESYVAAVGAGGKQSFGSSLLDMRKGKCHGRRIDLLADKDGKLSALPHELTHVVVADLLGNREIPRWLDEGMAVLADSAAKQQAHAQDLHRARLRNETYPVAELLLMDSYPSASRIPAYYAQSASLTAMLVRRGKPKELLAFVDAALDDGYDQALNDVYSIKGIAELDRMWRTDKKTAMIYASSVSRNGFRLDR